ncbi:hypothetical protein [uncultured Arenimonas sp.]|uniref:hypothetical protein n=1 Tax=uncultured Arenimonas sp. TaxID=546226 RepID=UPI0030DA64DA
MEAVHAAGFEATNFAVQTQGVTIGVEGQFAGDAAALDFGQDDAGLCSQGDAAGGRCAVVGGAAGAGVGTSGSGSPAQPARPRARAAASTVVIVFMGTPWRTN